MTPRAASVAGSARAGVLARIAPGLLAVLAVLGCDRDPPRPAAPAPAVSGASSASASPEDLGALRFPAPARLVAVGDVHGDLAATRAALRLAGAIDEQDRWSGKDLVLVQTGDQIDRGDHDRAILDLFDRLMDEAKAAGGAVHALNGNHELMNVDGDFRYVTAAAFKEFEGAVPTAALVSDPAILRYPEPYRPRAAAFRPGGPYARKLARRAIAAIVGDTVFVHGGVLPSHVKYGLAKLDRETRAWLEGGAAAPRPITGDDAPVWSRRYSDRPAPKDCETLGEALAGLGAKRMVVGHTVQKEGISQACGGRVWRIDVGMSAAYGGRPEVLEIVGDEVRSLKGK